MTSCCQFTITQELSLMHAGGFFHFPTYIVTNLVNVCIWNCITDGTSMYTFWVLCNMYMLVCIAISKAKIWKFSMKTLSITVKVGNYSELRRHFKIYFSGNCQVDEVQEKQFTICFFFCCCGFYQCILHIASTYSKYSSDAFSSRTVSSTECR